MLTVLLMTAAIGIGHQAPGPVMCGPVVQPVVQRCAHPPPRPVVRPYHCKYHPKCAARVRRHRRYQRQKLVASMPTTVASWYRDGGQTASGRHYPLGFASLMYGSRWGLPVRFCHTWRHCATGQLQDHGPYADGRGFDLNRRLKAALRCGDLCVVHYRAMPEQPKG